MGRISSRAIIFKDNKVLLMFRRKINKDGSIREYFVVPGGGWNENETLEQNAIREVKEEMNIDINITNYVGLEVSKFGFANYFKAEIKCGKVELGGEEKWKNTEENFYKPMYLDINKLDNFDVVGKEYILKAYNKNFSFLNNAILTDQGICPTCYDRKFNGIIFGDNKKNILFSNKDFEVFLCLNPRALGHTIISTKKHYKDMMEIDDVICEKVFKLAKKVMKILKDVYQCESVYLCTMCDGPNNHFHIQLIPRYRFEKRGSINFIKDRKEYVYDEEKTIEIKNLIKKNK